MLPSNHQLSVVNDVDAEDDRPNGSVHQADGPGCRKECSDKSKEEKNHKHGKENTWNTTSTELYDIKVLTSQSRPVLETT